MEIKAIFNYPKQFTTLPEYSKRRGQVCIVLGRLGNCDDQFYSTTDGYEGTNPLFRVVFSDGFLAQAWLDELELLAED